MIGIGSRAIYNRSNRLKNIRCIQQTVDKLIYSLLVYPVADAYEQDVRGIHLDVRISGEIFKKAMRLEHSSD